MLGIISYIIIILILFNLGMFLQLYSIQRGIAAILFPGDKARSLLLWMQYDDYLLISSWEIQLSPKVEQLCLITDFSPSFSDPAQQIPFYSSLHPFKFIVKVSAIEMKWKVFENSSNFT